VNEELKVFRGHAERHEEDTNDGRRVVFGHVATSSLLLFFAVCIVCVWKSRVILKRVFLRIQEEIHHNE
jgi:hypothetical protein